MTSSNPKTVVVGRTAGPWAAHPADDFGDIGIHRVGEELVICAVIRNGFMSADEVKANAAFIVRACNSLEPNERKIEELTKALSIFLGSDDRFQVAVGGNPIAVDQMLARARALLSHQGVA